MSEFKHWFQSVCGYAPYPYQERVAMALGAGESVVLRAPTGAGKTRAAILPFLMGLASQTGLSRLIYVLPMRTLAQGIHRDASELMRAAHAAGLLSADLPDEPAHDRGDVRLQTGEAPGDPFFSEGRVVVATYDQLLSGLLHSPYGASDRLHNINGAVLAGSLVVFDEFHLMEIGRAFMTAGAFVKWFDGLCRTIWMTATATSPVVDVLTAGLSCREVTLSPQEEAALPSVGSVSRTLDWRPVDLSAEDVVEAHESRSIVICNTVGRGQSMARNLRGLARCPVVLLHSRFFQRDRRERERELKPVFGPKGRGGGILVATQVVEAGLDLSCEHLWTEIAPMNALVQRAGRCARFADERGRVHVRNAPGAPPYKQEELDATAAVLPSSSVLMTPQVCRQWVESAHGAEDAAALQATSLRSRLRDCRDIVKKQVARVFSGGVSHLIREADDSVFVMIRREPPLVHLGYDRSRLGRRALIRALGAQLIEAKGWRLVGWSESGPAWEPLRQPADVGGAILVCLHPAVCRYDDDGLQVGIPGERESGALPLPERPGYKPPCKESWLNHARMVSAEAMQRIERDRLTIGIVGEALSRRWSLRSEDFRLACHRAAALHDLGKLQLGWQRWARDRQQKLGFPCATGECLAHTDHGSIAEEFQRPPHASASAVIAERIREESLGDVNELLWDPLLAAIVAHHGGWIYGEVQPVEASAMQEVVRLLQKGTAREFPGVPSAIQDLQGFDVSEDLWPLASILTRVVRLSDQRATAEWSGNA